MERALEAGHVQMKEFERRELCGLTQGEIGRAFDVGAYAVSKAVARVAKLALCKRRVGKAIERIQSNV